MIVPITGIYILRIVNTPLKHAGQNIPSDSTTKHHQTRDDNYRNTGENGKTQTFDLARNMVKTVLNRSNYIRV